MPVDFITGYYGSLIVVSLVFGMMYFKLVVCLDASTCQFACLVGLVFRRYLSCSLPYIYSNVRAICVTGTVLFCFFTPYFHAYCI